MPGAGVSGKNSQTPLIVTVFVKGKPCSSTLHGKSQSVVINQRHGGQVLTVPTSASVYYITLLFICSLSSENIFLSIPKNVFEKFVVQSQKPTGFFFLVCLNSRSFVAG